MKTLDHPQTALDISHYPPFWEEEWLQTALHELSTRNFSPEHREQLAHVMARRADVLRTEREQEADRVAAIAARQEAEAARQRADEAEQELAAGMRQAQQEVAAAQQEAAAAQQAAAAVKQEAAAVKQEAAAAQQAASEHIIRKLLELGQLTVEQIASIAGATPEQVRRWQ